MDPIVYWIVPAILLWLTTAIIVFLLVKYESDFRRKHCLAIGAAGFILGLIPLINVLLILVCIVVRGYLYFDESDWWNKPVRKKYRT